MELLERNSAADVNVPETADSYLAVVIKGGDADGCETTHATERPCRGPGDVILLWTGWKSLLNRSFNQHFLNVCLCMCGGGRVPVITYVDSYVCKLF